MGKYSWSDKETRRREERRPKPIKKIVNIPAKGKRLAKYGKLYTKMRKKFLEENSLCQCGEHGCTGFSTQVHHKKGRGIWLLIVQYWLAVCSNCHKFIENNPKEAKEKGYSLNRIE